jgi:RimJ/RimL family protein N-acetyltransferase
VSTTRGGIELRRARPDDAPRLFEWANDPATRAASFDRAEISWTEHVAWLAAVLADPDRRLWIAEESGIAVGQLRVDRTPDGLGTVSIGLAPRERGRGLGRAVLRAGLAAAVQELEIGRARAVVMADNLPSRQLFEGAGFVAVATAGAALGRVAPGADQPGRPAALVLEVDLAPNAPTGADPGPGR